MSHGGNENETRPTKWQEAPLPPSTSVIRMDPEVECWLNVFVWLL